ncbi:hypothetical protein H4R34_001686 [Dimargaris verticillata]|uniref:RanBD1 domain-containing protein n=1 Tax=Dimargaris verticillata TaxID=2761393 RepID=A0A9W8EAP6_9FUNG|nr:hypothetical protein H4R34_001686 [Dimargaris verticillata]
MVKRSAEMQLTKLNQFEDDNDDAVVDDGSGFRKASDTSLAQRKIKKPSSRLAKNGGKVSAPQPAPFAGFGGFGANNTAQPSAPTAGVNSFSGFSFGSATSTTSFSAPSFGAPRKPSPAAESSMATEGRSASTETPTTASLGSIPPPKTFQPFQPPNASTIAASGSQTSAMFNKPAATTFQPFKPPTTTVTTAAPTLSTQSSTMSIDEPSELTDQHKRYLRARLGLNKSFQKALEGYLTKDPYIDLAFCFAKYEKHLKGIQDSYQGLTKPASSTAPSKPTPAPATSHQPQPATAGFGRSSASFSAPHTQPGAASFTGFATSKPMEPATALPTASDAPMPSKPAIFSSGFTFGGANKPADSTSTTGFGFPSQTTPAATAFGFGGAIANGSTQNSTGDATSTSGSTAKPAAAFTFGTTSSAAPAFGSSSSGSAFGGFGASPAPSTTSGGSSAPSFTFGSTAGSANPFTAGSAFSFQGAPNATQPGSSQTPPEQSSGNGNGDDNDDAADTTHEANDETASGQPSVGEEDEDSLYQTVCKVFSFDKKNGKYADLGVGHLRINQHRETKGIRLLCRQRGTDKITLNVAVFAAMKFEHTAGKKDVVFDAVAEGGALNRFIVRVKTPELATETLAELESARDKVAAAS